MLADAPLGASTPSSGVLTSSVATNRVNSTVGSQQIEMSEDERKKF